MSGTTPTFIELFAGGGFARLGLAPQWRCAFANDISAKKGAAYTANFGDDHLSIADIASIQPSNVPTADLAWASFPCQDLSLAGLRRGMTRETRSGAFWPFYEMLAALRDSQRAPRLVVLENVVGAISSANGEDFRALIRAMSLLGYQCGALVIDAALFTAQSRPRLFIVAVRRDQFIPGALVQGPREAWSPSALSKAETNLARDGINLVPFAPPVPSRLNRSLDDVVDLSAPVFDEERTAKTLELLSLKGETYMKAAKSSARILNKPVFGAISMRTRVLEDGTHKPQAEPRFDGLAGCLRTPSGGSSHQILAIVHPDQTIALRRFTPRECARLMGAPDHYVLPDNHTQAYKLCGDAVAPPAVRFLDQTILTPLMQANAA